MAGNLCFALWYNLMFESILMCATLYDPTAMIVTSKVSPAPPQPCSLPTLMRRPSLSVCCNSCALCSPQLNFHRSSSSPLATPHSSPALAKTRFSGHHVTDT
eukprot:595379-Rhodomonas_salina.1